MKCVLRWKERLLAAASAGVLAVTGVASALSGTAAAATSEELGLDNYAKLLQYSLYFFDANMCGGEVGEKSAFSWRDDCHTEDTAPGGFHDAGDNIKFGQTEGFSASTLGWTYYEFKEQFDKSGTTAHLKTITDYFCDFFKASTTLSNGEVSSFVYQVDINSDHNTWCPPEGMASRNNVGQNVFQVTSGASDIAAQYAAALAQNYINFGDPEDLTYATALYDFAVKYRTPAPANENNYNSNECQDDISWAAGWMYLATKEEAYKTESSKYTSASNYGQHDYMWQNSGLGAAIINAEITGNWSSATNYIDQKVNSSQNQYYLYNSWGSARHNTLMQLCALVCTKYKDESGKDYSAWAKKQMNYILGDNSANVCFVVGYNNISATSPHHRAASNITISADWHEYNNWDGKYSSSGGHALYGALVGGPYDTNFGYNDSAKDATSNEVAIDYQVGLVGAAAALYAMYDTGSVVAEIGPEVTVYPEEVAVANGETPGTTTTTAATTTEATTTTTENAAATTTTEAATTTTENAAATTTTDAATTTTTAVATTTGASVTTTVTIPQGETLGNAWLCFSNGVAQYWGVGDAGNKLIDDAGLAQITGNGSYSVSLDINPDGASSVTQLLLIQTDMNIYQEDGNGNKVFDDMEITIDSVIIDGNEVAYTGPSSGAVSTDNGGTDYRFNILNTWGSSVKDIDGDTVSAESVVVNFTVSGLKTAAPDTTTTVATTTTNAATTTASNTTTTAYITTTTEDITTTTEDVTTTTESVTTTENDTTTTVTDVITTTEAPVTTVTDDDTTTTTTNNVTTTTTITTNTPNPKARYGDVNEDGKVSLADAVRYAKYLAEDVTLSDQAMLNADCNADGTADDKDMIPLVNYLVKIVKSLPSAS